MTRTTKCVNIGLASILSVMASPVRAEVSAKDLLDLLVSKGIISSVEADGLRSEAERNATPAAADAPRDAREQSDQLAALAAKVAKLQRTTVGGYIQARATIPTDGSPGSNLFVRRARLNVQSQTQSGRTALSFEGGQNQVAVKDAYFDWLAASPKGSRQGLTLRVGQFFRPFGLEIERGASDREFPERPVGWGALFPGNRDQGMSASVGVGRGAVADVAIVNGGGASTASLSFRDPDNYKDMMGRIRYTLPGKIAEVALSGYHGRQTIAGVPAQAATTGYVDSNGNGRQDPDEEPVVITPARAAIQGYTGDRTRLGLAANLYHAAGGVLRAEVVTARDVTSNLVGGSRYGTTDALAYYLLYTHPVGTGYTVGVRYDAFDPDTHDRLRPGGDGEVRTFGVVGIKQINDGLRLTLAYEAPRTTRYDKVVKSARTATSGIMTLQGQMRF